MKGFDVILMFGKTPCQVQDHCEKKYRSTILDSNNEEVYAVHLGNDAVHLDIFAMIDNDLILHNT